MMSRTGLLGLLTTMVLGGCSSQSTAPSQSVTDVAAALGGEQRLRQIKSIVMSGSGVAFNLGQDLTPEATDQTFSISDFRRVISFSANALRTEQTRTPGFAYFQGPASQKQIMGADGDVGYNISPLGVAVRVSEVVTRQRRVEMFHHPIAIVRAALEPGAEIVNARTVGAERLVDVKTSAGVTLTLAVDATTSLPTRVTSSSYDINLGDVVLETGFSQYRDVSGVKVPTHIVTKTDHWTTADLTLTTVDIDGITGDLAAPEDAVASRPASSMPEPVVDDDEVASGVWALAGQSHHSVLIELADQLVLVEAPQHEARTLAVIRRARELRKDKPLTRLVNSHHHFDHSAGVRAAVSEGLTIVTHSGNAQFFRDLVQRQHTVNPDALARRPHTLTLETVDDMLEIKDSSRTIQIFHVTGSPHSSTMLMVYLPAEKLLIEADAFTPSAPAPFARNLLDNVQRRGLAVDRIVPLHGTIVPFDELRKAVAASTPTN